MHCIVRAGSVQIKFYKKLTKVKPARLKLWAFFFEMEKLQWFKFTPTDWVMGKIQRCPETTQARFMRLICLYWNKECVLNYEDAEIEIDKDHLEILINKKIIKVIDDFIQIEFLNEQLCGISETSEKRRQAVLQRWNKVKQIDTSVSNNYTSVLQKDTEKRREEKRKIIEDNIDSRKLKFAHTLKPFINNYTKELIREFYNYWTEPNKSNTKFKQELERTWSLERRLETWAKNDTNFNNNNHKKQKQNELTRITNEIRKNENG